MIIALLIAAAAPTAVDAEYDFARDAQKIGQWTAFRKYADHDAVMFTPQAVWARDFLQDRKDPPRAVRWAPAHSFVSCDGRTAVNTGPWWGGDGVHHGYFTTVWQRTNGAWRWVYDGGAATTEGSPTPTRVAVQLHRASCRTKAPGAPVSPPPPLTPKQARTTPEDNGRGQSADKTVGWDWKVDKSGARKFRTYLWTGTRYGQVIYNDVPAPPSK
ncbi:MAG: hypothetical protein ACJ8FT_08720 [Sphingomonas sp.]